MSQQQPNDMFQTNPRMYYIYLRSQGVPPMQAMSMTQQRFGSPQDSRKQQSQNNTTNALLGTAGAVVGYQGAKYIGDTLFSDSKTPTTAGGNVTNPSATPTNFNNAGYTGNSSISQADIKQSHADFLNSQQSAAQTPDTLPGGAKVIEVKGDSATIKTPTGQTQQVPSESLNDSDFWNRVNWGDVAQGGLGLYQMYSGYKNFKNGDKVGGGLNMATGAANTYQAGSNLATAGAEAGSTGAGTMGAYVIPGLNLAAGAYGAYQTAKTIGDAPAGKSRDMSSALQGGMSGMALTLGAGALAGAEMGMWAGPIGMAVGAALGYAGSRFFGSHKSGAQMTRDKVRDVLKQNGVLDNNWNITLADGSKFDIGKEKPLKKWSNIQSIIDANPNSWNAAVPGADAMSAFYGIYGKNRPNIAVMYANAAVSNANNDPNIARENMAAFAKQQGITFDQMKGKFDQALKDGDLDQNAYNKFMFGAQQLFNVPNVANNSGVNNPVPQVEPGKVVRLSPGMYRTDKGNTVNAPTMRQALEQAYNQPKKQKGK